MNDPFAAAVRTRRRWRPAERLTAVVTALVLVASLCLLSYRLAPSAQASGPEVPPEFAPLVDLYDRLQREAVRVPEGQVLVEGAIEGMLETLEDPYAAYYNADQFTAFNELLEGQFSGVGIVVEESPEGLMVVDVLEGTPADAAGVEVGERIVSVDGRDVQDLPTGAIVELITGEAGTDVTVGFDGGSQGPRELRMTRAEIAVPDVESRLLADGIGYVGLLSFSDDVGERLRAAVSDLVAQGARGIAFDLRGNPGGLLTEAVAVAGVFIEDGIVVTVRHGERPGSLTPGEVEYEASGDAFESLPLVVLVNRGSASASEIVAGAIQDHTRGEIIGETTFGKGTVQTIHNLSGGAGAKFTTAEYFTPSGDSIEGVGVVPDEIVTDPDQQLAAAEAALRALVAAEAAA